MAGVIEKFFITSMAMWIAPIAILYGFYYGYIPGNLHSPVTYSSLCFLNFLLIHICY
jgi:VMA21-like domain